MAQSPINLLLIQFNAIELKDWIDLVDQPYGGSGKASQQRKLISLIWFVGDVSWSAHQIQIKQIHSFLWKDELLIEFACCSLPLFLLHLFSFLFQSIKSISLCELMIDERRRKQWSWPSSAGTATNSIQINKVDGIELLDCSLGPQCPSILLSFLWVAH